MYDGNCLLKITILFLQVIVVHVGTNNVENTPEQVCEGILEIIRSVREKHPSAYIVLPVSTYTTNVSLGCHTPKGQYTLSLLSLLTYECNKKQIETFRILKAMKS